MSGGRLRRTVTWSGRLADGLKTSIMLVHGRFELARSPVNERVVRGIVTGGDVIFSKSLPEKAGDEPSPQVGGGAHFDELEQPPIERRSQDVEVDSEARKFLELGVEFLGFVQVAREPFVDRHRDGTSQRPRTVALAAHAARFGAHDEDVIERLGFERPPDGCIVDDAAVPVESQILRTVRVEGIGIAADATQTSAIQRSDLSS